MNSRRYSELVLRVLETGEEFLAALKEHRQKERRRKRIWVRKWIGRRSAFGGAPLLRELQIEDPKSYQNALV